VWELRNLLGLCTLRTGQLLSQSQLGRDAKLSAATVARYLSLFETSFLVYRLSSYLRNRASRLIRSAKLYFTDSGLAGHLAGVDSPEGLADATPWRGLFETFVAQKLLSLLDARLPATRLHFWGVQGRHVVRPSWSITAASRCRWGIASGHCPSARSLHRTDGKGAAIACMRAHRQGEQNKREDRRRHWDESRPKP